jgi:xylulokinase
VFAISVAGQQHGLVVLDGADAVIRPAKLWNDTESAPDARWLIDQLDGGAAAWVAACGSLPRAAFTIAKLSWLHRCEPDAFERIARVLLPHDWLTHRLTGDHTTDRGDASGTGYWSPSESRYRLDLLDVVDDATDWTAALPRVLSPLEAAGEVRPGPASELGVPAGVLVAAGSGDNMAAALGVGLRPGDLAVSIGTSGTVYAVTDEPTADVTGAVAGFADATGRFLPLVCTLNATLVTDAVGRLLGVDHDELDALALAAPPGAGGLVLVPYFAGERTPDRPDATGTVTGLRTDVSRAQLARAAVEGVVCGLLDGIDALAAAGVDTVPDARLLLVGGGARSTAYRRVLADLTGRTVTLPDGDEHTAAGACVQAAAAVRGVDPITIAEAWRLDRGRLVEPGSDAGDPAAVRAAYAAARD